MRRSPRLCLVVPALFGALGMAACSQSGPAASAVTTLSPAAAETAGPTPAPTQPSPTALPTTTVTIPATARGDPELLAVPELRPPIIDGVLGPGEWDGAVTSRMSDGGSIWLLHSGETLYLAVDGGAVGSVNAVLAGDGEIRILHSSAALGSALYRQRSGQWELQHGFSWCCRSRDDDAGRLRLLEDEGWQATIGYTGDPGIVEYQIAVPWQGASLAVSSIRNEDDQGFWPTDLPDEAQSQLVGVPPETRRYDTDQWPVVVPGDS